MRKAVWLPGVVLSVSLAGAAPPVLPADPPERLDAITVTGQPAPVPELRRNPVYPMAARQRWEEGCVVLRFTIRPDGKTDHFAVMESNPRGVFERAVIDAVFRWRYAPSPQARTVVEYFEFRNPGLAASTLKTVVSAHRALDPAHPRKLEMQLAGYRPPRCREWESRTRR